MKFIGNFFWFFLTGLYTSIVWFLLGIVWCITIIGIPFGKQCFKLSKLSLFPFGKVIDRKFSSHPFANIIWFIFGGLELAIGYFFAGIIWCITIIGIPFGKQCFKLSKLAAFPFGATILKASDVKAAANAPAPAPATQE